MKLQLLSDLHLETESFHPEPAAGADLLVLAGDIDARWDGLQRFADWPVPVLFVPGNHEFDGRDLDAAVRGLRERCERHGVRMLYRETWLFNASDGRRIRFLGATRWSDFDLFGAAQRERAMRASRYFLQLMSATRGGQALDAEGIRSEGLACRRWLEETLALPARGHWDASVVITHFAPSLRSADPRYGRQPGTASFCNADDDLIGYAELWLHGHLHCRHDYLVPRAGRAATRVVCQARGLDKKGEPLEYEPLKLIEV